MFPARYREWYFGGTVGVGTLGEEGCTVGGGVVQIVAVPWEWYFGGTVGMGTLGEEGCTVGGGVVQTMAVPWEAVLCK